MKRSILTCLFSLLGLLCPLTSWGESRVVTIDQDEWEESTASDVPYNTSFHKYATKQFLYTKDEIGEAGTITKIAFKVRQSSSKPLFANVTIYMGHYAKDIFTSNAIPDHTTLTEVFSFPTMRLGEYKGWETIQLDTPFEYDGNSNLVIAICQEKNVKKNAIGQETEVESTIYYAASMKNHMMITRRGVEKEASYISNTSQYEYLNESGNEVERPALQLTFGTNNITETEVTIGESSTVSSQEGPYFPKQRYCFAEFIYPGTSVPAGTITKLAFKVENTSLMRMDHFAVFMAHRSGNSASFSNTTDILVGPDLEMVYSGSPILPILGSKTGWETIEFNQPFYHNGKDNIVVAIEKEASSSYYNSDAAYYYTPSIQSAYSRLEMNKNWHWLVPSAEDGTLSYQLPVAKFSVNENHVHVPASAESIRWSWTNGYQSANAEFECAECHTNASFGAVINEVEGEEGYHTYQASITLNGITYTDQQAAVIKVECIEVTPSELSINTDQTATLTAAVTPATALNTTVHWTSSDEKIATVSEDGVVTPKSDGTAIITASTTDGTDLSSYCTVTVTCSHNGHGYVDLGLPSGTLWATMNVGAVDDANNPIRIKGSCYGWGSTTAITNRRYDSDDYNVTSFRDVASSAFGEGWCMPTKEQWEELLEYGQKVTNSREVYTQDESFFVDTYKGSNGNTIDFPLAGMYSGGEYVPGFGCYWTQTPDGDGQAYYADLHYNPVVISGARYKGLMVRPVLTERAERVFVTAISVTNTETTAVVGSTFTLHADVQPADATTKAVKWSSSDYTIATVSANGEVTILKPGTVTFTATAKDMTGVTGAYTIEAYRPALTSLTISESSYELIQGETTTLEWSYEPAGADVESLTWSSSNESVATVNDKGIVTAVAEGTATITLASTEGPTASCEVTVKKSYLITVDSGIGGDVEIVHAPKADGSDNITIHISPYYNCAIETVLLNGEDITADVVDNQVTKTITDDACVSVTYTRSGYSQWLNFYWIIDSSTGTLHIMGKGAMASFGGAPATKAPWLSRTFTKVIIHDGLTNIGVNAFPSCSGLTSVIIPESVTSIGDNAFSGCSSLNSVTIPNSVTSIGGATFYGCSGLTSITIPNGVTSIGSSAFSGCSDLTSVTIPNSVTSIGKGAFKECSSLNSVIISESVTSIGDNAFDGCSGLTSVIIPEGVTSIGSYAFNLCSGLTSVIIPEGVTSIGSYAFSGCSSLNSVIIPESVISIGDKAFYGCSGLISVTIPNSVTSIGDNAFYGCSKLSELRLIDISAWLINILQYSSNPLASNSLPKHLFLNDEEVFDLVISEDVKSIPANAFTNFSSIRTITLPESLASIANNTGFEMSTIERIVLNGCTPPTLSSAAAISTTCMIMVPAEALDDYKTATYWKNHAAQIVGSKENVQFDYDVHVTASATLSALHIAIGEENLPYVQSLKVTGTINSYDIMIINNKMTNLRNLDLSDASIVANSYEYYTGYCSKDNELDRYSIPKRLHSLQLPKTLKVLGQYALEGCDQMLNTELILPDGLLSVAANTFYGSNWSTIVIPESVTSIANKAFASCNALRALTLPYAPTTLFSLGVTTDLQEVTVIQGAIPAYFACKENDNNIVYKNLSKVTLGETVNAIGDYAFKGCSGLTEFRLNKEMQIGYNAFKSCYIRTLYIPHDCHAVIDRDAFPSALSGSNKICLDDLDALFTISWTGKGSAYFIGYGEYAIYVNGELVEDLVIPEGITELNDAIFSRSLIKTLTLPSSLLTIGKEVFNGCRLLESVAFPSNLESIDASAFKDCTSLQAVSLPTTLKTIGDYAFQGCKAMTEVRLSPSITKIGAQAFNGCTALNDVYTYTIEPQSINETTFSTYATSTLHCPAVSYYNYYYDTQWSKFLKLENFDEPYEYVYIAKDFDIYTETAGVISGKPRMDIAAGGGVTVTGNREQELGDVHIMADANSVASLIGNDNLTAENLYLDITVKADYWHFFCFPFDVDLTKVQKEGSYIFRRYDGVLRAQNGGGGWQDIEGTTLHAGEGYIFRTNTAGLLSLPIVAPDLSAKDVATSLEEYASENTADKSWNFIGNPYLAYYDINDIDYTAPIVIWDGTAYTAYRPGDDEYVLQPFQPFFLQRPANVESAGFDTEGRTTYLKSQDAASSANARRANARRAKAQRLNPDRLLINLTLTDGTTTDKARVAFNDKQSLAYEMECDAAKFISTEQVPLLYSLDGEGTKYAINERPAAEGTVQLGFTAPRNGTYTIAATRMDTPVYIEDKVTGEVHFLNDGDFTFHAEEGTDNSRFVLALAAGDITGIGNNEEDADVQAQAPAYDLQGRKVTTPIQGGVYIVNGKKVLFE